MGRDYPLSPTPEFDGGRKQKKRDQYNAKQEELKKDYSNPNPKIEWKNPNKHEMLQRISTDTSGFASGKERFTQKHVLHGGKEGYRTVPKLYVQRTIARDAKKKS